MAFYDKFPYTNFQEINLDRIIQELITVKEGLQFVIDNASLKYADPIQWKITSQYQANTVVIDPATGIAYISTKPVPDNILITDAGYWTPIFDLSEMFETIKESICFNLETGATSDNTYNAGSYFFIDNSLYKALTDISEGTAFLENVNVKKVSVTELITDIESDISGINSDIEVINGNIEDITETVENISTEIEGVTDEVITEVNEELTYKLNSVFISTIRKENPDYTDDQLMNAAIAQAHEMQSHPLIVWDHHNASFSGSYSFNLSSTSGVDFNHQTINMPAVDFELFYVDPDDAMNKNVSSALLDQYYVSDSDLFNKYFAVNTSTSGSAQMCAGNRYNSTGEIYVCYGIVTDPKGNITNNKMDYLPSATSTIPLYNIHTIPDFVTVFKNAHVIYPASDKMALLLRAKRSRLHISNIKVTGYTNVTTYHTGVLSISSCAYIEVDHIYGSNPIQEQLTSGYLLSLFNGCTDIYIHDCDMHDSQYVSWGMIGMNCLTNIVMERVNTSRFDCHYFAFGYVTIRDCHLDYINMCAGVCNWTIDSCMLTRRLSTLHHYISLRSDSPGRPQGDIRITNCRFRTDTNQGADPRTTRFLNMSMVHGILGSFTASGILSALTRIYISDCTINYALCVIQCDDFDPVYTKANLFMSNCCVDLVNEDYNTYVLYRADSTRYSGMQIIESDCGQLRVSILSNSEVGQFMINNCNLPTDKPIKCTSLIKDFLITGSRFGGFDITVGTMFTTLVCVGNYADTWQPHISSSLATNYVFSGNASRDSVNIADWINSNSYGV